MTSYPSHVGDTGIIIKIKAVVYNPDTDALDALDIVTGSPTLSMIVYRRTDSTTLTTDITASQSGSDYFATWDQPDSDDSILTEAGTYRVYLKVVYSGGQELTAVPIRMAVEAVD